MRPLMMSPRFPLQALYCFLVLTAKPTFWAPNQFIFGGNVQIGSKLQRNQFDVNGNKAAETWGWVPSWKVCMNQQLTMFTGSRRFLATVTGQCYCYWTVTCHMQVHRNLHRFQIGKTRGKTAENKLHQFMKNKIFHNYITKVHVYTPFSQNLNLWILPPMKS